jgi:hypothetical protein
MKRRTAAGIGNPGGCFFDESFMNNPGILLYFPDKML